MAYLDILALDQPVVPQDLTVIPITGMFAFGTFNAAPVQQSSCIAHSGFYCQNMTLHDGTLSIAAGQGMGSDWQNATFILAPYPNDGYPTFPYVQPTYNVGTWNNGDVLHDARFNVSSIALQDGQLTGMLYVNYTIGGSSYVSEFAAFSVTPT